MGEIGFENKTRPTALQSAQFGAKAMVSFSHDQPVDDIYYRQYAFQTWDPNDI